MKVIDMPGAGLAKVSSGDLLRELSNELGRVRRRLKRAQRKLAGLRGNPATVFAAGRLRTPPREA
jgi:hypothetical protein